MILTLGAARTLNGTRLGSSWVNSFDRHYTT